VSFSKPPINRGTIWSTSPSVVIRAPEIIAAKEDMNEDGITDFDDFAIFALLYEKTYTNSNDKVENISISWGDFNSDGSVDFDDFAVFALSYGK